MTTKNLQPIKQRYGIVGNSDGTKSGESFLIGSANNDTFIAGAHDEIITGSGNNDIRFSNTSAGYAIIDQSSPSSARTVNHIQGCNPLTDFIRTTMNALSNIKARFVNGTLFLSTGNTTNIFSVSNAQSPTVDDILELLDTSSDSLSGGDINVQSLHSPQSKEEHLSMLPAVIQQNSIMRRKSDDI